MHIEIKVAKRMRRVSDGAISSGTYGGLRSTLSGCVTIYGRNQRKTQLRIVLDRHETAQLLETLFVTNSRSDLQRVLNRAERAREKAHKKRVTPKPVPKPRRRSAL